MATMTYAVPLRSMAAVSTVIEMALVPLPGRADDEWSIDQEPMGPGWHDSSSMLRKGLDVIEGLPPEVIAPEWPWRWWLDAGAGV